MSSLPVATVIADAFREIAVFAPNAAIPPDDFAYALGKLNRLLENMTEDRRITFAESFTAYVLIPGHNPHTIGPTGDWMVTTRPLEVRAAQLILTNVTPNVYLPVEIIGWAEWASLSVRAVQTSTPLKLYYDAQWPNGNINLYPVPSTAYQLELVTRTGFVAMLATDTFTFPPGYQDYVTLMLARSMAPAYPGSAQISQQLLADIAACESKLFNTNVHPPRLATADFGMPGNGGRGHADMNWIDRSFR